MQGPNVKKLIAHKISLDAIQAGGGLADGIAFLTDPKRIVEVAKMATVWVNQAIAVVRTAAEPNPWKTASDEEIAAELLSKIKAKQAAK